NTVIGGWEGAGVRLYIQTQAITIGGTVAAARNIISGNAGPGILITDTFTTNNVVEGNYIGTDSLGTTTVPNATFGVDLEGGTSGNTIGGASASARNLISGNQGTGVELDAAGNTVQGNWIGVDVTGNAPLGNVGNGIVVQAGNETIGGPATAPGQ